MDIGGHQQLITNLSVGKMSKVHKETGDLYDDITVYSCAEDNVVLIWDAQTLTCKGQLTLDIPPDIQQRSQQTANGAVFSRVGSAASQVAAAAGGGGQGTLLSAPPSLGESRPFVTCKGIDGMLYVGDRGGCLQQWDVETLTCMQLGCGHTSSVRALAVFFKIPYQHSLVLSGSDDGTLRAWKNSNLVKEEKEGMRLENERIAQVCVCARVRMSVRVYACVC
jgi:WD40 repeat protein